MVASIGLTDEQQEIQSICRTFAAKEMSPFMREWDENEIFPKEVLKSLAQLGFGAVCVKEEFGGSGLKREDASVIFEALSAGCVSTTAYLSIHNMCAWMIDYFGNNEQRQSYIPAMASMEVRIERLYNFVMYVFLISSSHTLLSFRPPLFFRWHAFKKYK